MHAIFLLYSVWHRNPYLEIFSSQYARSYHIELDIEYSSRVLFAREDQITKICSFFEFYDN